MNSSYLKSIHKVIFFTALLLTGPAASAQTEPLPSQPDDYKTVMLYLKSLSIAIESYALEHGNIYPAKVSDLTSGDKPYVQNGYCGQTIGGYTYYCVFSDAGYTLTATPTTESALTPAITIKTDVLIESGGAKTAQDSALVTPREAEENAEVMDFLVTDEIDKYKDLVAKDPKNYKDRLILANLYAGRGEGRAAAFHAEEVLSLNPDEASLKYAYHTAIQGYYLDGNLNKSIETIDKLLVLYPTDETALSFKKNLTELQELEKYREKMRKRVNFAEYLSHKTSGQKSKTISPTTSASAAAPPGSVVTVTIVEPPEPSSPAEPPSPALPPEPPPPTEPPSLSTLPLEPPLPTELPPSTLSAESPPPSEQPPPSTPPPEPPLPSDSIPEETSPMAVTPDVLEKQGSSVLDISDTLTEAMGGLSLNLGEDDFIIINSGKVLFQGPPKWFKVSNVRTIHGDSLLLYSKFEDKQLPAISVTIDTPDPDTKTAMEFSLRIKEKTEKEFPEFEFSVPVEVEVNGLRASLNDMKVKSNPVRSVWYQFLVNEKIITIQYMNTLDDFDADLPLFQSLVESMKLDVKYNKTL